MDTHPLKAFRESQDPPLTQDELASRLGVTKATVSRWESGTRKPDEDKLPTIAEKTGIQPSILRPDLAERAAARASMYNETSAA